ncbi:MAG: OB-fold putative lipoprotein [Deltaproteobacteria bacterium]|nr:OB-fold putative lipoprotein [Deltaproteobacteria bacterium]
MLRPYVALSAHSTLGSLGNLGNLGNLGTLGVLGVLGALVVGLLALAGPLKAQMDWMTPIHITPRQLVEAYLNDFHAADARYTGKLVVVTGRIRSIVPPDQTYRTHPYPYVTMDSGPNQPLVIYLWEWEAETLAQARPGRTTSVMGFCQGVTPQLSLTDACLYPGGCGGPVANFYGPYFKLPPTPQRRRTQPND